MNQYLISGKPILLFMVLLIKAAGLNGQAPMNPWTPPEFFPSRAVLVEWDFNNNIWPLYSELIDECQEAAEVILVVRDQSEENIMRNKLLNDSVSLTNISFVHVPCERMWIRDHGPLSVMTDEGVVFIDLDDFANSGLDENLPENLANAWGLTCYTLPYVFCGGNFMVNSFKTLFTTERIYTNNASYSQAEINSSFRDYMGITDIVTVSSQHEDYWGHIDMQIKLLDDTTMVIASVDPGSGPNYDTLESNFNYLSSLASPFGGPYRIRRLPMADNWKTYTNSLMLNNKLILPLYNHPYDSIALQVYQELLPQHDISGINCNSIIGWEGAIHCITMQLFDESQITAVKQLSVRDDHIFVFPNPVNSGRVVRLLCPLDHGEPVRVNILNMNGQVLESINLENQSQPYSFSWKQEPGIYSISVVYNDGFVLSTGMTGY